MLHSEWEKLVKHEVTPEDYRTVEQVYMYHPMIGEGSTSKTEMLKLYNFGGIGLIESMLPDADRAEIMERDIKHHEDGAAGIAEKIVQFEEFRLLALQNARDKRAEFNRWKERFNR